MSHRLSRLAAVVSIIAVSALPLARVAGADTLPVVSIRATDGVASEPGINTGTFTVTRTGNTTSALTVSYTVSGSATSGTDFTTLSNSVVIPAGSATGTILVTALDDLVVEPTETVMVTLAASS